MHDERRSDVFSLAAVRFLLLLALFGHGSKAALANDVSGLWTGVFLSTETGCGGSVAHSGTFVLNLAQSGSTVTGTLTTSAHFRADNCTTEVSSPSETLPITGAVTGNTLNIVLDDVTLNGTFAGDDMDLGFSASSSNGRALASRSPLAAQFGGTWSGPFSGIDTLCAPACFQDGTFSVSITQTGTSISGTATSKRTQAGSGIVTDSFDFAAVVSGRRFATRLSVDRSNDGVLYGYLEGNQFHLGYVVDEPKGNVGRATLTSSSPVILPAISTFTATPSTTTVENGATLAWTTQNASTVTISSIGSVPNSGTVTVRPNGTSTFTLIASNPVGSATATATVTVNPKPPSVAVTRMPSGMVVLLAGVGLDSYTLTNVGGASTTITLPPSGGFFSQSPTSFLLPPGGSQVVRIVAPAGPAPQYWFGWSTPAGVGVPPGLSIPIRLSVLVPISPIGGFIRPFSARTVLNGQPGGTTNGSISFNNDGSADVEVMAVSDVPWILPDEGIQTIPARGSKQFQFRATTEERPAGATSGSLRLQYLSPSTNSDTVATLSTQIASSTAEVISMVPAAVGPHTPEPLGDEAAVFIPGVVVSPSSSDLYVASSGSADVNLRMIHAPAGSQSFSSTSFSWSGAGRAWFPQVAATLFNSDRTGTLQLRGTGIGNTSYYADRIVRTTENGTYLEALPIFRADRTVASGARIALPGVSRSESVRTHLYVQETAGASGTFRVDFLNSAGTIIPPQATRTLRAFEMIELLDAVPAGVATVRVFASTANPARFAAYALVVSTTTGDAWRIQDSFPQTGTAPETYFVPIAPAAHNARTSVFVTNRTTSPVNVTVDVVPAAGRRRVVPRSTAAAGGSDPRAETLSSVTLQPNETRELDASVGRGYARVRSTQGAVSVSARTVTSTSSAGKMVPFGGSLCVVPSTAAMTFGHTARFPGIRDSTELRSELVAFEAAGQPVVLRVTATYSAAGTSRDYVSRSIDYTLPAAGQLHVGDLLRSVLGDVRDSYGDIQGELELEVVEGGGSAIVTVVSTDSRSGDFATRCR